MKMIKFSIRNNSKKCVNCYKGDRHAIKFIYCDQFMVMSFAQFTDRSGLDTVQNFV